jgi:hypothetical protein
MLEFCRDLLDSGAKAIRITAGATSQVMASVIRQSLQLTVPMVALRCQ